MRVLVNALSIGSLSGAHVLFGHLRQLALWTQGQHEFVVLGRSAQTTTRFADLPNVELHDAPRGAAHWLVRSAWEAAVLPRLMRRWGIDLYFTPAGTTLLRSPAPQVSLAQNPWCMVPAVHRHLGERAKARLQRRAYRTAYRRADLMVYNSQHMREMYGRNAPGDRESQAVIAYQGIDDETHQRAAQRSARPKDPARILAVSVMAHWKGIETVVSAIDELRRRGVPCQLTLAGPWPDAAYHRCIERQIADLDLHRLVQITGMVSREALHEHYAASRAFCLMSRCESFGIPAVEAQAFGTPVVGSNTCAMPEVGGAGGRYVSPDDVGAVSDELEQLLVDEAHWQRLSAAARDNADRFRWELCSRPLLAMFGPPPHRPSEVTSVPRAASPVSLPA